VIVISECVERKDGSMDVKKRIFMTASIETYFRST